jgi:GNAT superfamily N-acetyltransferase
MKQLTGMLHRAFSRLGEMGISCSCVNQAPAVTRRRVTGGDCFVAVSGHRIVGTITLYAPDTVSEGRYYRDARVASARQLGVDPQFQGLGVGVALLHLAESWARRHGYARLALDTPEPADHLIGYYQRQGFQVVERLHFSGRPYRSVIFAKSLVHHGATDCCPLCPETQCAYGGINAKPTRPDARRNRAAHQHHSRWLVVFRVARNKPSRLERRKPTATISDPRGNRQRHGQHFGRSLEYDCLDRLAVHNCSPNSA